jgi:hypothetical protein
LECDTWEGATLVFLVFIIDGNACSTLRQGKWFGTAFDALLFGFVLDVKVKFIVLRVLPLVVQ